MTDWKNRIVDHGVRPASEFVANPKNWRTHPMNQRSAVEGSLNELGWIDTVIVNKRTGYLVDGHERLWQALKAGDDTPVPFIEVDLSEEEEALALASLDPIAAMAGADKQKLDELIHEIQTGEVGLQEMLGELAEDNGLLFGEQEQVEDVEIQIDKAEELRIKWGVESGQLWRLGEHRLICGDCTEINEKYFCNCNTLIHDPDWDSKNIPNFPKFANVLAFCDGYTFGHVIDRFGSPTWVFAWDCVASWYTPNRPLRRMKNCLWYGDIAEYDFDGWHYGDAGEIRNVKNTRGAYEFIPDPRGKHLSDIYQEQITKLHSESAHSHSKPIDWMTLLIANCTNGNVYDPFLGSGTTLIACERLNRKCRAVEISPAYVAIAIQRWVDVTGGAPELIE